MRRLMIAGALGILVMALAAACSSGTDPSEAEAQRFQDMWEIDQIEKNFHEATSMKDIDLMMSLYAPNATFTVGGGETAVGEGEIRGYWLASPAFDPTKNWVSSHPAYKLEVTVNGDRGTLHFECHFIDANAEPAMVAAVTAGDADVARIDGEWLITNFVGGTTEL